MNVGKLYLIKQYYWLLYPSKETAEIVTGAACRPAAAKSLTSNWSKQYNCNVTYIPENSIFCLLEQEEKFLKVLTTNGELGWIIYSENVEWAKGTIEEVKQ